RGGVLALVLLSEEDRQRDRGEDPDDDDHDEQLDEREAGLVAAEGARHGGLPEGHGGRKRGRGGLSARLVAVRQVMLGTTRCCWTCRSPCPACRSRGCTCRR